MASFKIGDERSNDLLQGFQIDEFGRNCNIFYKNLGQIIQVRSVEDLRKSKDVTLHEKIYYHPFYFPLIDKRSLKKGVAWSGWLPFDFDTEIIVENGSVNFKTKQRKKIRFNDAKNIIKDIVDNNFRKFLNENKKFVLPYSQGIDSLVALSYIVKYNRLQDATLFTYHNTLTNHPKLNFMREKELGIYIETIVFTEKNLSVLLSTKDPYKFFCYNTHHTYKIFPNTKILFPCMGNKTLIHDPLYQTMSKKRPTEPFYVTSCKHIDPNQTVDLNDTCLVGKQWKGLENSHLENYFDPFNTPELFEIARSIDYFSMAEHQNANAEIARELISANVGSLFDNIIKKESLGTYDAVGKFPYGCLDKINLPIELIDEDLLIPKKDKRHNLNGLRWLQQGIKDAKKNKVVPFDLVGGILTSNFALV